MSISIITGTTFLEAIQNCLQKVEPSEETFIVVPDRTTLQIEEMLFDAKNLTSTFNINVVGLGNLALKYVERKANPLSEIEAVMFVKRAIENQKENLNYFKSTNINFCQQMYKLVSQFKSSSIKAEDIKVNRATASLQKKLADIKTIYSEFEILTQDKDDPSELIDKFVDEIENKGLFQNSNFFFVAFDSFTSKHYSLIKALSKNAKSVTIGMPAALTNQTNAYIYETDIFDKIKKIAMSLDTNVTVTSPASTLSCDAKAIRNQLFGREKQAEKQNHVRFFECKNRRQEADMVAKIIVYEVFHGARFKDFAVAVTDIKAYQQALTQAFEKNGIPYYFDVSQTANEAYCALFFKKMLALKYKGFRKNDLLFLLTSPFFDDISDENLQIINSQSDSAKAFYMLKGEGELKKLVKDVEENALDGAMKIAEFIESNLDKLNSLNLDEKTLSMELQVPQILRETLDAYRSSVDTVVFSEMLSAIEIGLETRDVSAIPSYYDQVYVGDVTDSFFGKVKNLFVIGANAGVMPKVEVDSSVLSDEELDNANLLRKVEPTIKMINRRARFKLFSLLCSFENRMYVSYSLVGADDKPAIRSSVVNELLEIFDKSGSIISSLIPDEEIDAERLCLAAGKNLANVEEIMSEVENPNLKGFLAEFLKFNLDKFKRNQLVKEAAEKLGLGKSIKPTEIERFYDCPFKFMCEKVLCLKESGKKELTPLEIGSIIHDALERYGKIYAYKPLSDSELDKFIDEVLGGYDFSMFADDEVGLLRLKRDLKRICKIVCDENLNSMFKPWMLEEKITASVGDKSFYGRVDRVDKYENYFRVLDYKTGRIATNLVKQLSVGKKLQLFAYAKFISEKTGLKCGGVYYFDAKAGYSNRGAQHLVGITNSELKEISPTSSVLGNDEFEKLEGQAETLMLKASKHMEDGRFLPAPDDKSCQYCPFKSVCLYDFQNGTRQLKGDKS